MTYLQPGIWWFNPDFFRNNEPFLFSDLSRAATTPRLPLRDMKMTMEYNTTRMVWAGSDTVFLEINQYYFYFLFSNYAFQKCQCHTRNKYFFLFYIVYGYNLKVTFYDRSRISSSASLHEGNHLSHWDLTKMYYPKKNIVCSFLLYSDLSVSRNCPR